MHALWTRETHGEAKFILRDLNGDSMRKRENVMFSFPEEKQQQAPFRSIAGETDGSGERLGVVSSENEKALLCSVIPSDTLTHT